MLAAAWMGGMASMLVVCIYSVYERTSRGRNIARTHSDGDQQEHEQKHGGCKDLTVVHDVFDNEVREKPPAAVEMTSPARDPRVHPEEGFTFNNVELFTRRTNGADVEEAEVTFVPRVVRL